MLAPSRDHWQKEVFSDKDGYYTIVPYGVLWRKTNLQTFNLFVFVDN